jgi:protein farnesyltransferase/geranylgeranyltransferase type-1 subunit alpha
LYYPSIILNPEDKSSTYRYTKQSISQAPNNASAWNYLRGVLDRSGVAYVSEMKFVEPYAGLPSSAGEESDVMDLENPPPPQGARLPCPAAIEFIADVYEKEPGRLEDARKLWTLLATQYDTIRKKYWEYRIHAAQ